MTTVSLVKTPDRSEGIRRALQLLAINPVDGKSVLLKPNFNTADPFPGSTHEDTLRYLVRELRGMGANRLAVGDRSFADTEEVLREKGIYRLCEELGVEVINFESLGDDAWVQCRPQGSHWLKGFRVAGPVVKSECVVSTCCLKTHGYGAKFTLSLKNSIGTVHRRYMTELHASLLSMEKMIAEVNTAYVPSLILLDGIEVFVDGGPMTGVRTRADLMIAGTDRIAIDATGVAVLKALGSNRTIMEKKIFELGQIKRAVELGLGVDAGGEIRIVTDDEESEDYARKIREILAAG